MAKDSRLLDEKELLQLREQALANLRLVDHAFAMSEREQRAVSALEVYAERENWNGAVPAMFIPVVEAHYLAGWVPARSALRDLGYTDHT